MPLTTQRVDGAASGSRLSRFLGTQLNKTCLEVEDLQDALTRPWNKPISSSTTAIKQCPRAITLAVTLIAGTVGNCVLAGQWKLSNLLDLSNQVVSGADLNADTRASQEELFALVKAYDRQRQLS